MRAYIVVGPTWANPAFLRAFARAIDSGDVVGTSHLMPNYPRPVLWRDGVVIDLLADNPTYGVANAINDRGQRPE